MHIAWDNGALTDTLGRQLNQKTVKTMCGKRVSVGSIDNKDPFCSDCIALREKQNEGLELFRKQFMEK